MQGKAKLLPAGPLAGADHAKYSSARKLPLSPALLELEANFVKSELL